jgi:predicted DsbA family dithiol-disulfide isomerase
MLKWVYICLFFCTFMSINGFSQSETAFIELKKEQKMKIEVWSDIMCPFCYIGKRNYEKALSKFKHAESVELVWKSFQLDPSTPTTKVEQSTYEYLAERKGWSMKECKEIHQSVTKTAKQAGLVYDFDNVKVANSFNAHRIIQLAKTKGLGDQAKEQFFKAHFTNGRDLNDKNDIVAIAELIGLTKDDMEEALTNSKYEEAVYADIQEASQLGIQGVPFFVMNRKYAVSGAQSPDLFLQTIEKAYEEWKKENPASPFEVIEGKTCTPNGECK